MRKLAVLTLLALAGCGEADNKAAEPPASGTIPPGTYSNASTEGEAEGWRVMLAQGEVSKSAQIARCAPECGEPASIPLRMGMGGLMADYPDAGGQTITLAIRPHGDGIEVAADWGQGMESHKLVRVAETATAPRP